MSQIYKVRSNSSSEYEVLNAVASTCFAVHRLDLGSAGHMIGCLPVRCIVNNQLITGVYKIQKIQCSDSYRHKQYSCEHIDCEFIDTVQLHLLY